MGRTKQISACFALLFALANGCAQEILEKPVQEKNPLPTFLFKKYGFTSKTVLEKVQREILKRNRENGEVPALSPTTDEGAVQTATTSNVAETTPPPVEVSPVSTPKDTVPETPESLPIHEDARPRFSFAFEEPSNEDIFEDRPSEARKHAPIAVPLDRDDLVPVLMLILISKLLMKLVSVVFYLKIL